MTVDTTMTAAQARALADKNSIFYENLDALDFRNIMSGIQEYASQGYKQYGSVFSSYKRYSEKTQDMLRELGYEVREEKFLDKDGNPVLDNNKELFYLTVSWK